MALELLGIVEEGLRGSGIWEPPRSLPGEELQGSSGNDSYKREALAVRKLGLFC